MKKIFVWIFLFALANFYCQDYQGLRSHYPDRYKWKSKKECEKYLKYLRYWGEFKTGDVIADIGTYNAAIPLAVSVFSQNLTFYLQECQPDRLNKNGFYEMKQHYERVKGEEISNHFSFVIGQGNKTGLPDSSFDKIMLNSVFEYVGCADLFLNDLRKKLKPGGKVYVRTDNPYAPEYYIKIFQANGFTCVKNLSKRGLVRLTFESADKIFSVEDIFDAVLKRDAEKAKLFLDKGELNTRLGKANVLLAACSVSENDKIINLLLGKNVAVNIDRKLIFCLNPLSKAVAAEQTGIVKILLEHGAKAEYNDLMMAAWFGGDTALIDLLLTNDKPISERNKTSNAAFYFAAQAGEENIVNLLASARHVKVNSIMDTNSKSPWNGQTLLHWVAQSGNVQWMKRLLKQGGNINQKDTRGNNLLFHAVYGGNLEMVKFLCEANADFLAKNAAGLSVFDLAYDPALQNYLTSLKKK